MSQQTLEKELRQPDEFVGFFAKIVSFLAARLHLLIWGVGALVVAIVASMIWFYVSDQKNTKAADALNAILKSYPNVYAEKDYPVESWESLLKQLEEFQKTYGSTGMNQTATLYQANIFMRLGKFEDALASFKKLSSKLSKPYAYMAQEGQAQALHELKKWDESEKVWKELASAKENPMRAQHTLSLGMTQEEKGAFKEATQTYQMFEAEFPASPLLEKARSRLAIVKTK